MVHRYKDRENFIVSLQTKSKKDQVFIIKQEEKFPAEEIVNQVKKYQEKGQRLSKDDEFMMPKIEIKHARQVKELVGQQLENAKFKEYFIASIYEIIKLDIDETGVKVENEGGIKMVRKRATKPKERKEILVDRSFWLVMKEVGKEPYLVAFISETQDK